jgi:methylmalonyl-CoA/ethylmalonyl-CoA epimerase
LGQRRVPSRGEAWTTGRKQGVYDAVSHRKDRQIALTVADADRSQTFYGEVLGLPLLYRFDTLVFFDLGNLRLMLGQGEDVEPGNACIYLRVGDIDAAHAALGAKGLTFQDGPKLIARMPDHELWMAFFQDPDGHQLALMHEKR